MKQAPSTAWSHWLQRLGWGRAPMLMADDPASMGTAFGLEMSLLPEPSTLDEPGAKPAAPPAAARLFSRRHR